MSRGAGISITNRFLLNIIEQICSTILTRTNNEEQQKNT